MDLIFSPFFFSASKSQSRQQVEHLLQRQWNSAPDWQGRQVRNSTGTSSCLQLWTVVSETLFSQSALRAGLCRRLYPDMAFFQRPTEYPCQLILDPQNDYETLRRRVEQTTLKAQTVNRNRSGVTNVSLAAAARTPAGFPLRNGHSESSVIPSCSGFPKKVQRNLHCVGKTEAIWNCQEKLLTNFEISSKHDVQV